MTKNTYKNEVLLLRSRLQATGHGYLGKFLDYWFPNLDVDEREIFKRDLKTFLKGAGFVHAYSEPYAFYHKILEYLEDEEVRQKKAQQRTTVEGRYKLAN